MGRDPRRATPGTLRLSLRELLALMVPAALACRWPFLLGLAIPGLACYLVHRARLPQPPLVWYRIVLPVAWVVSSLVSWNNPGGEYAFFVIGSLPAVWAWPLLDGRIDHVIRVVLPAGALSLFLTGWAMDRLRVCRPPWLEIVPAGAAALTWWALAQSASYSRAMAENGSLTAYIAAAISISLYLSAAGSLLATPLWRLVRSWSRPAGEARDLESAS
jgi:hypothetical protein